MLPSPSAIGDEGLGGCGDGRVPRLLPHVDMYLSVVGGRGGFDDRLSWPPRSLSLFGGISILKMGGKKGTRYARRRKYQAG